MLNGLVLPQVHHKTHSPERRGQFAQKNGFLAAIGKWVHPTKVVPRVAKFARNLLLVTTTASLIACSSQAAPSPTPVPEQPPTGDLGEDSRWACLQTLDPLSMYALPPGSDTPVFFAFARDHTRVRLIGPAPLAVENALDGMTNRPAEEDGPNSSWVAIRYAGSTLFTLTNYTKEAGKGADGNPSCADEFQTTVLVGSNPDVPLEPYRLEEFP